MPFATITKNLGFVIFAAIALAGCHSDRRMPPFDQANSVYDAPKVVGQITSNEIDESSGLAASPCINGLLWTHNDSGDGPFLYALDMTGKVRGVWRIPSAENIDWEDMEAVRSSAGCSLYIGEIGNSDKLARNEHRIYRVAEPGASQPTGVSRKDAMPTAEPEVMRYRYPDGNRDAETLMVHPETGDIYVLTKSRNDPSSVYKIKPAFGSSSVAVAEKVAEIKVPVIPFGMLTGGSISPDGKRVVICDYAAAYELLVPEGAVFDDVWKQMPTPVPLGERKQGEAITYSADGRSIVATSERGDPPIIEVRRKQ